MPHAEDIAAAQPVPSTPPGARTILASIALAFAGFLATAAVLHAAIRDPLHLHADVRSEKLAMLSGWHGKVFSAAFGSSHVHNGFDPRVFDATLAGSPASTRSANLAVEGGSQTEQFVMARQFLQQLQPPSQAAAPPQPCFVMLELSAGTNFANGHLVDARAIDIYDWHATRLVTHFVTPAMDPTQHYGRLGFAAIAMGLYYSNVGMLSNQIFAPPLNRELLDQQQADDRRGQAVLPYHASFLPTLYGVARQMPKHPAFAPGLLVDGNGEMIRQLAALAPTPNVSFLYVVMPRLDDLATIAQYPDHLTLAGPHGPLQVPILNLGRPDLYPQMYNPELWYDETHLTGVGARMATALLAQQLKQWYAAHGGPTPCG